MFFKIDFSLANSAKPTEMPRYVAFHLGLSCLQKYLLGHSSLKSVKSLKVLKRKFTFLALIVCFEAVHRTQCN